MLSSGLVFVTSGWSLRTLRRTTTKWRSATWRLTPWTTTPNATGRSTCSKETGSVAPPLAAAGTTSVSFAQSLFGKTQQISERLFCPWLLSSFCRPIKSLHFRRHFLDQPSVPAAAGGCWWWWWWRVQRGDRFDAEEQTETEEGRPGPGDNRLCCVWGQRKTSSLDVNFIKNKCTITPSANGFF